MKRASMAMHPTAKRTKRKKTSNKDQPDDDHLSSLPDELLHKIVSHLPFDLAIRTSILCRRFHRFILNLPRVPFLDLTPTPAEDHDGWVRRCDDALSSHVCVKRCRILDRTRSWKTRYDRFLNRWFDDRALKGVESLTLETNSKLRFPDHPFLPPSKRLESLELIGLNLMAPSILDFQVRCVNLRTLKLSRVLLHQPVLTRVLSVCNRLVTLHLDSCYRLNSCNIDVGCSLESLLIRPSPHMKHVKVDAPGLRNLFLRVAPWMQSLCFQVPRLESCHLHASKQGYEPNYALMGSKLNKLLPQLLNSNITQLALDGAVIQCLLSSTRSHSFSLPTTMMVRKLSIGVDLNKICHTSFMVKLLEACPHLHEFTINEVNFGGSLDFPVLVHNDRLKELKCYEHCLQKVDILDTMGGEVIMEIAEIILEKAVVLKRLKFQISQNCSKEQMEAATTQLLSHEKASSKAMVVVKKLGSDPDS